MLNKEIGKAKHPKYQDSENKKLFLTLSRNLMKCQVRTGRKCHEIREGKAENLHYKDQI